MDQEPKNGMELRILLIGSGGIGTITALNLEACSPGLGNAGRVSVTAVLRSNYKIVSERGFRIESCDHGDFAYWRPTTILPSIPDVSKDNLAPFHYIIITTKNNPDVPPPLPTLIAPAVTANWSTIVLIQNGINIEKPFITAFPTNIILSGVSRMGAAEPELGHITQDDPDRLYIGAFHNPSIKDPTVESDVAQDFVRLYNLSGKAKCEYNADIAFVRWRKLLYNCVWNPICALTDLDTGRFRLAFPPSIPKEESPLETLVRPAMHEVRAVAKAAAGVELAEGLVDEMIAADPIEIFCVPSMLQDVRKGQYVEVENILGEVVREGRRTGVPTPTVSVLYALLKARQWGTMEKAGLVDAKEEMKKLEGQ